MTERHRIWGENDGGRTAIGVPPVLRGMRDRLRSFNFQETNAIWAGIAVLD